MKFKKIAMLMIATLLVSSAFMPLGKKKKIVFFGDSITFGGAKKGGYIRLLESALKTAKVADKYELIGAGISGNKVPDLQARLENDVLSHKPDLVFIYIGINDVWHWELKKNQGGKGTTAADFESGLKDLINKIEKAGADVVLCTPSVIGEKNDLSNEQDKMLDEYAEISRKVARESKIHLCDLRKAFVDYLQANNDQNTDRGILTTDRVHLNSAGNVFVALQMLPFLDVEPIKNKSAE